MSEMKRPLTESEFWKHTIEQYGLEDKFETIASGQWISCPKISKISAKNSDKSISTVLLGNKIRLDIQRAAADGENFMSQVFRVRASENDVDYHCFLKMLPENPTTRDVARKLQLYQREIHMYSDVVPYLQSLLTQSGLNPAEYLLIPELYYANLGLNKSGLPTRKTIVVLEDLRLRGLRMLDNGQDCDLAHAKCALRSLASIHALSNVMLRNTRNLRETLLSNQRTFDYLAMFTGALPQVNMVANAAMFQSNIQVCIDSLEQLGYHAIVKKLAAFKEKAVQYHDRQKEDEIGLLACLTHGDFWRNNILFQYDPQFGLPIAAFVVDWQVSGVGHPGRDISYFFMTSTSKSLWRDHWNELLLVYFEHHSNLLYLLGVDLGKLGYTVTHFLNEFAVQILKALPLSLLVLPIIYDEAVAAELQRGQDDKRDFQEENNTFLPESSQVTMEARNNYGNAASAEQILSNHLLRDRYSDLLLELMGRGWL